MWSFCLLLCPCLHFPIPSFWSRLAVMSLPPTPSALCTWAHSRINPVETFFYSVGVSLVLAKKVVVSHWKVPESLPHSVLTDLCFIRTLVTSLCHTAVVPHNTWRNGARGAHRGNTKFLPALSGYYGQLMWCLPLWSIKCFLNPIITAKIVKWFLKRIISTSIR